MQDNAWKLWRSVTISSWCVRMIDIAESRFRNSLSLWERSLSVEPMKPNLYGFAPSFCSSSRPIPSAERPPAHGWQHPRWIDVPPERRRVIASYRVDELLPELEAEPR